jgi:Putative Na+/H+ antiporter
MDHLAAVLFALALIHTFSAPLFARLAHASPRHAGLWHVLSEVEIAFGLWALVFMAAWALIHGQAALAEFMSSRQFTEPLFVCVTMILSATRPVLQAVTVGVNALARCIPLHPSLAVYGVLLSFVPLMGSLITEPAAMTLAALLLRQRVLTHGASPRLLYATLGVLFVNVSIGGTLTPFAAPPVLMVAHTWGWDLVYMLEHFGWRSALAVMINAVGVTWLLRHELTRLHSPAQRQLAVAPEAKPAQMAPLAPQVPWWLVAVHLVLLTGVIASAHHALLFVAVFVVFLGLAKAYPQHHDRLIVPEALQVGFFLCGLVVLGGAQAWWLQPLVAQLSDASVFWGALALTAVVDNAALTYLGSTLQGLSEPFQLALVGGAVAGGGLTVIANAPNPAGFAILKDRFPQQVLRPEALLAAAALPTLVAAMLLFWR